MTKTTHIKANPEIKRRGWNDKAACGRMVSPLGIVETIQEVTCKGCRKNG